MNEGRKEGSRQGIKEGTKEETHEQIMKMTTIMTKGSIFVAIVKSLTIVMLTFINE